MLDSPNKDRSGNIDSWPRIAMAVAVMTLRHHAVVSALAVVFVAGASGIADAQSLTLNGGTNEISMYSGTTVSVHAVRGGTANRFDMIKLYAVGGSTSFASYYLNGTSTPPVAQGHDLWLSEVGIGDNPTDSQQQNFVASFFDQFDDAAEFNPPWTTSIFYRLDAPSTSPHYQFSLLYNNDVPRPAFYKYQEMITEFAGESPVGSLGPNESLTPGASISSNTFELIYQLDGDLALYEGTNRLWHTLTTDANEAAMQSDGNFVVYNTVPEAVWSTGTTNNPNGYLVLQMDGELRLYTASGRPIWTLFTPQP